MTVKDSVRQRIINLCETREISINKLGIICGVTQSTFNNIVNEGSKNPKLGTINAICHGLEITLREFFDDDIFDDVEQEAE